MSIKSTWCLWNCNELCMVQLTAALYLPVKKTPLSKARQGEISSHLSFLQPSSELKKAITTQ